MRRVKVQLPPSHENDWAFGCPQCKNGIVEAPELSGACELYLERLVQALNGDITFCACQAGTRYRVFLLNCHRKLIEESKSNPLMLAFAMKRSHPDIEQAQRAMTTRLQMFKPPTVRWVEAAQPPETDTAPAQAGG